MDSSTLTPILNLLTTGADPTLLIEQFAKRMKTEVHCVSMGQGQEVHARHSIRRALLNGTWVLLQNCHLALSYVQELFIFLSETRTQRQIATERLLQLTTSSSLMASDSTSSGELIMSLPPAAPSKEVSTSGTANTAALVTPSRSSITANDDFRLWITTEENPKFPVAFLQVT